MYPSFAETTRRYPMIAIAVKSSALNGSETSGKQDVQRLAAAHTSYGGFNMFAQSSGDPFRPTTTRIRRQITISVVSSLSDSTCKTTASLSLDLCPA